MRGAIAGAATNDVFEGVRRDRVSSLGFLLQAETALALHIQSTERKRVFNIKRPVR